ncbi:hypothetical protein DRO64_07325, partial [Candidatus Bathyarchaeota archaeon]
MVKERVETVGEVEEAGVVVKGSRSSEKMNRDPGHENRCSYCSEWVSRLHGGSIYLYLKRSRLLAQADVDRVSEEGGVCLKQAYIVMPCGGFRDE